MPRRYQRLRPFLSLSRNPASVMPGMPSTTVRTRTSLTTLPTVLGGLAVATILSPVDRFLMPAVPRLGSAAGVGAAATSVLRIREVIRRVGSLRSIAVLLLAPQLAQLHPGRLH